MTDKIPADSPLRKDEPELRSFFEHFPGIILRMTITFKPVFLFGEPEKITGYTSDELLHGPKKWLDIVHPEDFRGFAKIGEGLKTVPGYSTEHEYRIFHRSGEIRWIRETIHNVCDESGNIFAIDIIGQDISDRKLAASAIEREKELWKKTFDSIPDLVAIIDTEFKITHANRALAERMGKRAEDLVGMSCYTIFHQTTDPIGACPHVKLLADGKEHFAEVSLPLLNGEFEVSVSPLFDASGNVSGAVHVARDITDKNRSQAEVKESRNYLDGIINTIGDPVFVKDREHRRILVNEAYCQFVGKTRDELIGKTDHDLFPAKEAETFRRNDDEVFTTGIPNVSEESFTDRTGEQRFLITKKTQYTDQHGGKFIVGVIRDETAKKNADLALSASEERYRTLIETANEAIFVIQDDWIKFFNPQLERLTGYSPEELADLRFADVIDPDDLAVVMQRYSSRIGGENLPGIYTFRFLDKQKRSRWVEVNAVRIQWGDRPATLNFLTDINERKRAEERLTGLNETFTRLTPDYAKNISLLTETCGKLLGPAVMLYNKIEGDRILSQGTWNTPPDFVRVRPAGGTICEEVIRCGPDAGAHTLRNLGKTSFSATNPDISRNGYKTYLGHPVVARGTTVGSLCAFYKEDIVPDESTKMVLGIIAAAISVEEERELAGQELKSRDAILEAINFAAETLFASTDWEAGIERVLARLGSGAQVDRAVIFERKQQGPDPRVFFIQPRFEWTIPGVESVVNNPLSRQIASGKLLERLEEDLSQGKFFFGDVKDYSSPEREIFERLKIRSQAAVPIFVDNTWWGFIAFDQQSRERTWSKSEIDALAAAASILGTAIQRTRLEELYHYPMEQSPVGIYVLQDRKFVYVNPKFAQMYGSTREDILGLDVLELINPEDYGKVLEMIRKRMNGELQFAHYELRARRKNGEELLVESFSTRGYYNGRPAIIGNVLDITVQRKAQKTLAESEERLRLTMEATNEGLWDWNLITHATYLSPRFYTLLGYEPNEFPASYEYCLGLVHPDDVEFVVRELNDSVGYKPEGYEVTFRMKSKSGEYRWILSRGKVVEQDASGKPVRMVGTHQDITERKSAEAALQLSEIQFRRTFDESPVGAAVTSLDFRFVRVNEALCSMLGYSKDELVGHSFTEFTHPEQIESDFISIRLLLNGTIPEYRTEKRYIRKDGRIIWARLSSRIVRDSTGTPLYFLPIMIDITGEMENRAALQRRDALLIAINIAAEKLIRSTTWKDSIMPILEQMGNAAEVGRVSIFQFMEGKEREPLTSAVYEWVADGVEPLIDDPRMKDISYRELGLGSLYDSLVGKKYFTGSVRDFPESAAQLFAGTAVNSILLIPVLVDNIPWGFICFDNAAPEKRVYLPVEIEALQVAADILGSTISRTRYEQQLERSLEEGAVLLREVHHRVRNNMQVISSLLSIQSGYISDESILSALRETESRIKSMALVHEKLYQSSSFATIDIGDYLRNLISDLIVTHAVRATICFEDDIDEGITLDLERSIPFGLIIHEIVANSLRHAFRETETGTIFLSMHITPEGDIHVRIGDDGTRVPGAIDLEHAETMGLQLIAVLIRQIDGTIQLVDGPGTIYEICFPANPGNAGKARIPGRPV